jgi:hypothetical protein
MSQFFTCASQISRYIASNLLSIESYSVVREMGIGNVGRAIKRRQEKKEEQYTATKKATWGSRFFWRPTIPEESLSKLRELSHLSI